VSRQRDRIETAFRKKGYTPTVVEWTPISMGAEKSGPDGGWYIRFEPSAPVDGLLGGEDLVLGLNVDEVLEDIARLPAALREMP
jgi:hypothetical protein